MLGAILAPFMVAGVLGALASTAGAVLVVAFFMLVDGTFARLTLFTLAASSSREYIFKRCACCGVRG